MSYEAPLDLDVSNEDNSHNACPDSPASTPSGLFCDTVVNIKLKVLSEGNNTKFVMAIEVAESAVPEHNRQQESSHYYKHTFSTGHIVRLRIGSDDTNQPDWYPAPFTRTNLDQVGSESVDWAEPS